MPLSICGQGGAFAFGVAGDDQRRHRVDVVGELRRALFRLDRGRVDIGRIRHHAGRQHDEVEPAEGNVLAEQFVGVGDRHSLAVDRLHLAFHEDDAVALGFAIELLGRARRAQFFIDDIGGSVLVALDDLQRLLDRGRAADRRAIGQMIWIAAAGALNECDVLRRRAVGRTLDGALGEHRLELDRRHHVRRGAVAEMAELGRVIRTPAGRHDDRADRLDDTPRPRGRWTL